MVDDIEVACSMLRLDKMFSPEQEVSILVLVGLTKHPWDAPNFSISVQKNSTSSCATVEEMSSMYAKRCAMLPKPKTVIPFIIVIESVICSDL